ncbi:probable F-box protein At1g65740 [Cucurbita moschata]|uniref:Probable F-box protein At1g65740 n=1 Tax=Cucurbita moschata TaxID=3662 RepID=A0A6J1E5P5_CUCMO|nr:probable F-box protein At1g65740 [Cucurbita moschata]
MENSKSRDWTALDYDVLGVILNKMVSLYDYLQFSLVCKSWYFLALHHKHQRSIIASKVPQLPMLIVPSKDGLEKQHCLYDLTTNIVRSVDFKFCFNKRCCGSSFGWLIMRDETLGIVLFNPFSGAVIYLPPVATYDDIEWIPGHIIKAILTKDPSLYPNDYMVVGIFGTYKRLCLIRANDKTWTYYYPTPNIPFNDINICRDTIYATENDLDVWKVEVQNSEDESSSISISVKMVHTKRIRYIGTAYITESSKGELLVVLRIFNSGEEQFETVDFEVYKLIHENEDELRRAVEVKSLDGDAIFIGDSQSICVSTKEFAGCLPNRIYFTDNRYVNLVVGKLDGTQDLGVFNFEDGSFEDHYIADPAQKNLPSPMWIIPTICSKDLDD